MAADLHVHIFRNLTEEDLSNFFSSTLGSKWFDPYKLDQHFEDLYDKVSDVPNIWIGEVSWLKAGLTDDPDKFVPGPVMKISDLIGEDLPVLNDELINNIIEALQSENTTLYELASPERVRPFLETYKGERVFTVSW